MTIRGINNNIIMIFAGITLLAMLSATIIFVVGYTEEKLAIEDSKAFTSMITDIQSYYSKEIVAHAKQNNIEISRDYKNAGTAIPFPATFTHEFIKSLNEKYQNINFHFYSDKPFYPRKGGGARNDFEQQALTYFKNSTHKEIYKTTTLGSKKLFYFARAIRMEQSCIGCHNTHPDSPYKQWKVGDLRGIHSIQVELPGFSVIKDGNLNPLVVIIASLYLFVTLIVVLLFFTIKKLFDERRQKAIVHRQNSELINIQKQIKSSSKYDLVTKLPNRAHFYDFLQKRIEEAGEYETGCSVLIIDLDHFKSINDRYGHTIGDGLLKEVGKKLQEYLLDEDIAARLSGDEFVICLKQLTTPHQVRDIANRIIRNFEKPINVKNIQVSTGASIGISRFPMDGENADEIISNAGLALNKAKEAGRQNCWLFDKELKQKIKKEDLLEIDLKTALDNNELDIFYQPKICLKTGDIKGFEALIRWPHANQGFIAPDEFLPIAEDRGLIIPVSRYVAHRVAYDMSTWLDKNMLHGRIAVNVHAHQLQSAEEMETLVNIFEDYNIPLEYLTLEITEGCVIGRGSENTFGILKQLSQKGIKISLDDFGTGFASLTHLKNLPVQEVKIDKSFLQDITNNVDSEAIVSAIIDLSRKIGLEVVAEGVETQEQLQKLKEMECDVGQGYLFSPPAMMLVANGLLSLPNLFREIVQETQVRPSFSYRNITKKGA